MDDWLVILDPSEWRDALTEGQKSVATHRGKSIAEILGSAKKITKRKATLNTSKYFETLKRKYRTELTDILERVVKGKLSEKNALARLRVIFNENFKNAYALGLKAQGVGSRKKTGRVVSLFTENDLHFIKTAVGEELRYMKKFIRAINEDNLFMSLERRAELYVNGLNGLFGAGRVAALPNDAAIWWSGPVDKNKCESCTYLMRNGPYLPHTLPATPKDGSTLCLSNCRDKLIVRAAEKSEVKQINEGKTRDEHIAALRRIRANRKRRRKK